MTNDPFGIAVDVKGEQLPITPEWQLNGDVDYHFGLTSSLDMTLGANVRDQSGSPATFGNAPGFQIPGYAIFDLRGGVQAPDGKWKAQIWGRNVGNKFYINSITHVTDTVARTTGMGATYGVTVSFLF
jgi:outer membrane receptor protein involved in Fe transport